MNLKFDLPFRWERRELAFFEDRGTKFLEQQGKLLPLSRRDMLQLVRHPVHGVHSMENSALGVIWGLPRSRYRGLTGSPVLRRCIGLRKRVNDWLPCNGVISQLELTNH
jgi:hypothetical protein